MVPGTQVGAYRLISQIGKGGMGTVWLAEHVMLGRRAAIKLLNAEYCARQDIVTRFFNEARAATSISDPGIVQIFDFGQHVDGTAYIAMEMLDGEPLDHRLARLGRFGVNDAMRIMRQVAATLGTVHLRGIVHRDLKPENIYLVRDPEVAGGERAKVLDFGIAKLGGDVLSKTNTSVVMGTPAYMSPEQCRGAGRVDQRSDVYALGCVLYALITGAPPFNAEGGGEIIAMHLREQPQPPSRRAPGISPELDALVLRCLVKEPRARFSSGSELASALGVMLGVVSSAVPVVDGRRRGSRASMPQPTPVPATAQAATTLSSSSGVALPRARRSRRWVLGALIGASAIAGVVIAASMSPAQSTPVVRATPPSMVPPRPEPRDVVATQIKAMLASFPAWAQAHPGAPCPTAAELDAAGSDPWGHPLVVTCTDQPRNHQLGVISSGPDGIAGNRDDIVSWEMGADATSMIRGEQWGAKPAAVAKPVEEAKPVELPAKPIDKPADKSADKPANKSSDKPADKLIERPRPKPPAPKPRKGDDSDIPIDR